MNQPPSYCPLCAHNGKETKVLPFTINSKESFYMCSSVKCTYPFGNVIMSTVPSLPPEEQAKVNEEIFRENQGVDIPSIIALYNNNENVSDIDNFILSNMPSLTTQDTQSSNSISSILEENINHEIQGLQNDNTMFSGEELDASDIVYLTNSFTTNDNVIDNNGKKLSDNISVTEISNDNSNKNLLFNKNSPSENTKMPKEHEKHNAFADKTVFGKIDNLSHSDLRLFKSPEKLSENSAVKVVKEKHVKKLGKMNEPRDYLDTSAFTTTGQPKFLDSITKEYISISKVPYPTHAILDSFNASTISSKKKSTPPKIKKDPPKQIISESEESESDSEFVEETPQEDVRPDDNKSKRLQRNLKLLSMSHRHIVVKRKT